MAQGGGKKRGRFITFEGPEGCGKTTQVKLAMDFLTDNGVEAILVREPGGTVISEKIRGILLDKCHNKMLSETELFLYMAARTQVVNEIIEPALADGINVICDRFLDATVAYQGYAGGIDVKVIKKMALLATKGLKPDLTIIFDVPVEKGLERATKKKADRMEEKSIAYHKRVRAGYKEIVKAEPGRVKILSGMKSIEEVHKGVCREIRGKIRF